MPKTAVVNPLLECPTGCQEGVKNEFTTLMVTITPHDLKSLREELKESLSEFGMTLKRAIDPKAKFGFTRQYISRLEKGKDVITEPIQQAFFKIAATFDGVRPGVAGAVSRTVMAQPEIPDGVLIPASAKAVKCAKPGCQIMFIKTHPRQKYHDPKCKP